MKLKDERLWVIAIALLVATVGTWALIKYGTTKPTAPADPTYWGKVICVMDGTEVFHEIAYGANGDKLELFDMTQDDTIANNQFWVVRHKLRNMMVLDILVPNDAKCILVQGHIDVVDRSGW